jgi:hypothetical protein
MHTFLRQSFRRLSFLLGLFPCFAVAQNSMPTVTPISSVPQGAAPGGGVVTRVTYEMKLAANDAGVAGAANDARYVSRAVTIAGPTMGGIVRGVVAGGLRLAGWVGVALLAYDAYKWYTDQGVLTQPGTTTPGATCVSGGSYFTVRALDGCSLPGAASKAAAAALAAYSYMGPSIVSNEPCMPASFNAGCSYNMVIRDGRNGTTFNSQTSVYWHASGTYSGTDPAVVTQPSPVTDAQLGDLAQQHPEWWPDMLRDPETGQPLVTPEIADDMNALRHQIAPDYGVDPTTLPDVQPDPDYLTGKAVPREQAIPEYCAWASAACDYYKFVEDNWPDADGKKQYADSADCNVPPSCSGDEVMCGVALQTFQLRCQFTGDGEPPESGNHDVSELYTGDVDLGDTSMLDKSGFGLSTSCPFTNISADYAGQSASMSLDFICTWGIGLRVLILLCAALACAKIMGGVQTNT